MTMNTPSNREKLIAGLAQDMEPVREFKAREGGIWVALALAVTIGCVLAIEGFWQGIAEGDASSFFWVTNGLLLLLGLASATAAVTMASPNVGNRYDAPRWAAAMVGVLPLAALIAAVSSPEASHSAAHILTPHCIIASLAAATVTGAALVLWLRRGAPVSLNLAGWFTGLAAGALGTSVYGVSCPLDTLTHLGAAHIVPVAVSAVIGRLIVPPLVRW